MKFLSILALVCLLAAPSASATTSLTPPDGVYLYRLTHSTHGELGTHRVTLRSDEESRRVTVERKLRVRVLLVTAYREETRTEEVWQDGRMVRFSRQSDDGDAVSTMTAAVEGGSLVAEGAKGKVTLPAGTFPTNPWNPAIVEQTLLMDTSDGHAVKVTTRAAGEETLTVMGQALPATRYEMTGDEKRTLWYDAEGRLVKQVIHRDGDTVTFTLNSYQP